METIRQSGIQDVEEKDETRKTLLAKQIRAAAKELVSAVFQHRRHLATPASAQKRARLSGAPCLSSCSTLQLTFPYTRTLALLNQLDPTF